uniref:Ig-like domain-containing protein n=1 Tax=Leptobrachium leishanense TaxID=445787 RepID=A0A8C5R0G7_9ANUR
MMAIRPSLPSMTHLKFTENLVSHATPPPPKAKQLTFWMKKEYCDPNANITHCPFLVALSDFEGAAVRPVVSFKPNWTRVFTGDSLTLTCNVAATANKDVEYFWFKDNKQQLTRSKHLLINSAETQHAGNYQCQSRSSDLSDAARLDVSYDWLILQVPQTVYEGDNVSLRCYSSRGHDGERTIFYDPDHKVLQDSNNESILIKDIRASMAGECTCAKEISGQMFSDKAFLSVKDLFSNPQIIVNQFAPTEGANVTVTCDASLSLLRLATELQFAFYKNGQNVQDFGLSHNYQIYPAQLGDTGDFTCEVKSSTSDIKRMSRSTRVQIYERFSSPQIKSSAQRVTEGASMTLTCETITKDTKDLLFAFYSNEEVAQGFNSSNKYPVQAAQLEESGNYTCEVRTTEHTVMKRSRELHIQIQELFSYPQIKRTTQGANLTLKCDTILTEDGEAAELQFAFYKNGENAQEFGPSNEHIVQTDLLRVSGDFTCEVRTADNSVRKRSRGVYVHSQGSTNYTSHNAVRMALSACLSVFTLYVVFHHVKTEVIGELGDGTSLQVSWSVTATELTS